VTRKAAITSTIYCLTVNIWQKCSAYKTELQRREDSVRSNDGVCDADGVLAAALPSPYLDCPRVSLNFIKLYQASVKLVGGSIRPDKLTTTGQNGGAVEIL
jgi:hypothetical protein